MSNYSMTLDVSEEIGQDGWIQTATDAAPTPAADVPVSNDNARNDDVYASPVAPLPFANASFRVPAPAVLDAPPSSPRIIDPFWEPLVIKQVAEWMALFVEPGQVTELRALRVADDNTDFKATWSGFFEGNKLESMARFGMELTMRAEGTYFTLNPLNPDLLARRYNKAEVAKDTAADKDVIRRRWLLIDTDPVRTSGVSATDEEKQQAWSMIRGVHGSLQKQGWPEPILCDSGNGYHLLYRIDLPSDDGGLVQGVLKALAARFDNARVKLDTSVFNPGRIVKLYGSVARKGESLRARPHRRTGVLNVPAEMVVVTKEQLEQVRGDVPTVVQVPAAPMQANAVVSPNTLAAGARDDAMSRARSYLAKVPGGIQGEKGSNQTFKAACILVRFGLLDEDAMVLFREWNQKCEPPWDEKGLQRKLSEARKKVGTTRMAQRPGEAGFGAVRGSAETADDEPAQWRMIDAAGNFLTNFVLEIDEDITILDDIEEQRAFQGTLTIMGRSVPFRINAKDYADNNKLKAAIFQAGGPKVQIYGRMDQIRTAISAISQQDRTIRQRQITTNFGWNGTSQSGDGNISFLVPSGRITTNGFEANDEQSIRVEMADEEQARFLDMKPLASNEELLRVKKHIIDDLLPLHGRMVTHSLLGAAASAVLQPFAPGVGKYALWLTGLTGAGKSFVSKLFANFFGDFPVSSGRFTTWSSTANYIQRQGYFHKDSMFLVDDYKGEVIGHNSIVRVLQTYADSTARGRLRSDATTNTTRPIRGLLVCTGEDVPEHSASSMARSIVIKVPQREKDLERGSRCVAESRNYSGVMADFVRWLIAKNRVQVFADRVMVLQQRLYADVAGQQNDSRICTNLALLGAAFEQMAEYFGDVWPEWKEAVRQFVEEDLIAIRNDMLGEVKGQQASEVFLRTLADLIRFNHVRIDGMAGQSQEANNKPVIGRAANRRRGPLGPVPGPDQDRLEICTSLALAEANRSLQQQGRPMLHVTESALLQQLREDGKLIDADGQPVDPKADLTRRVRINDRQVRAFAIDRKMLLRD